MTSKERVIAAMQFREPDRVPRYFSHFWPEFKVLWERVHGQTNLFDAFGDDMRLVDPDETAWPTRAGVLERRGDRSVVRTGWGEIKLTPFDAPAGSFMGQLLESGVKGRVDPEDLRFDDPHLDIRFEKAGEQAVALRDTHFVWCKSGGPYLRAAFMRGEEQFWADMIEDPGWTTAFIHRVADHITAVAIETIRRFGLQDSGVAIYDDVASNQGPLMGPRRYENLFLPALRRMIKAFKDAGARWVMHHSDGNVLPLLDMWVDAGVDAVNPLEYRVGMDAVRLRERFGNRLVLTGGLDNSGILPRGDRGEIREHILYLLEAARGGGFVIGTHSVGPDIDVEIAEYVLELLEEFGTYPLRTSSSKMQSEKGSREFC